MYHKATMKKSVSCFYQGRQIACVAREDVEIPIKPRKNIQRKPLPVPVRVMYDNILCAKGRYE